MTRNLEAENKVKKFYEGDGWESSSTGDTLDAQLWEDLRPCASHYVSACRLKLLDHLPKKGDKILDAASGPIQYPEYFEYSRGFNKRVCVDISQKALDIAKRKLGDRGEVVCTSILDLPFQDREFDAVVSLHTIYHIQKEQQEAAVRQLLRVSKSGAPVIVVYSNPNRLISRLKRLVVKSKEVQVTSPDHLYFFSHPNSWWKRFQDVASVEVLPWRSLTAVDARLFIPAGPGGFIGRALHAFVLKLEQWFPRLMSEFGAYPMIILKKR